MQYFNILIQSYSWAGIALVAVVVLLFSIQLFYYIFRLRRVGSYLNKNRAAIHETPPPVSLVVPMFSEDFEYLEDTLQLILAQEAVTFEIVIVYVGSDNDFFDDMLRLKTLFNNIVLTKIERNDRFPISVKTALNIGIKASHYEHIVFSTTDARPSSPRWLSLMARGFQRGDVVLGYCGVEAELGRKADSFMRISRLFDSSMWLSKAIVGEPYRAIRSNMGFTRSLYFSSRGFNHLNMNVGEDDLFMQKIMSGANTSVILSPRATVYQKCWGGMSGLVDSLRYYGSTKHLYPVAAQNYVSWEMASRVLFFILWLVGVIFLPLEIKVLLVLLALIRTAVVISAMGKVAERLGESGVKKHYVIYDVLSPLFALYMSIKMLKRDSRAWR